MTIKELIPKLIAHYKKCINEMPEENYDEYLWDNKVWFGICFCADGLFSKNIYDSSFIENFCNGNNWLCEIPGYSKSYPEAKELLQIRLNRLKDFL